MNCLVTSSSPLRLNNYSKQQPPARAVFEGAPRPLSAGRVCSPLRSLHAYESDLAVETERHSRRIIGKSSAFEYWWDDNKFIESKPSGRFYTIPMFYHGLRKESGKKVNRLEKEVNFDGIPRRNAISWPSNIDRSGFDSVRDEDDTKREVVETKGDLKL